MTSGINSNQQYQKKPESNTNKGLENETRQTKTQNDEIYERFKNENHTAVAGLEVESSKHTSNENDHSKQTESHTEGHEGGLYPLPSYNGTGVNLLTLPKTIEHIEEAANGDAKGIIGVGEMLLTSGETIEVNKECWHSSKNLYNAIKEGKVIDFFKGNIEDGLSGKVECSRALPTIVREEYHPSTLIRPEEVNINEPSKIVSTVEANTTQPAKLITAEDLRNKPGGKIVSLDESNRVPSSKIVTLEEASTGPKSKLVSLDDINSKPKGKLILPEGLKEIPEETLSGKVRSFSSSLDKTVLETRAGERILEVFDGKILSREGEELLISGGKTAQFMGKAMSKVPVITLAVNAAIEVPEIIDGFSHGEGWEQLGRSTVTFGGTTTGVIIGEAVGTLILPGIGTVAGGIIGGLCGEGAGEALGNALLGEKKPHIDYAKYYQTRMEESKQYMENLNRPKSEAEKMVENFSKAANEYCSMTPEQREQKEKQDAADLSPTIANLPKTRRQRKKTPQAVVSQPTITAPKRGEYRMNIEPAVQDNNRDRTIYDPSRKKTPPPLTSLSSQRPFSLNGPGTDNRFFTAESTNQSKRIWTPVDEENARTQQWMTEQGRMMYMADQANKNKPKAEYRPYYGR